MGTENGRTTISVENNLNHYERLRRSFIRCRRIVGNLEITHIDTTDLKNDFDEIRQANGQMFRKQRQAFDFLKDLEEVKLYVFFECAQNYSLDYRLSFNLQRPCHVHRHSASENYLGRKDARTQRTSSGKQRRPSDSKLVGVEKHRKWQHYDQAFTRFMLHGPETIQRRLFGSLLEMFLSVNKAIILFADSWKRVRKSIEDFGLVFGVLLRTTALSR